MTATLESPATAPPPPAAPRPVPPRLLEPLRIIAGRTRMLALLRATFKFLALAGITWLLTVLILGSRVQITAWLAIPLVVTSWLVVLTGAYRLFPPVFKRQNISSAAHLVDLALPDTQERISSAVELSQEKDANFRGSPELVACLIRQAEHHADCMNPLAVVSGKDVTRWFGALLAIGLIWFTLLVLMTPNVLLGLKRTFNPWSAAQALPLPTLSIDPGDKTLAQGQDLEITVDVHAPEGLSLDSQNNEVPKATFYQHFSGTSGGLAIQDQVTEMERIDQRSFRLNFRQRAAAVHLSHRHRRGSATVGRRGIAPVYHRGANPPRCFFAGTGLQLSGLHPPAGPHR